MKVTINANKVGAMTGDLGVMQRIDREIAAVKGDMGSADDAEHSFLIGKLAGLLMARDALGAVDSYEQALATWEAVRKP